MTNSELIKQLFLSFNNKDNEAFIQTAREYIEREKRKKHTIVAKELEKALYQSACVSNNAKRFKQSLPIPRDTEKGFPLLEIQHFEQDFDSLILSSYTKDQLERIVREFKDADILATYNLSYKKKILLCGDPGTGKTFSAQIISSMLNIPLVYIRFDAIISSYLGETAGNLRKVFDFIENDTWIVLFDEFDIIGKNRDDAYEHGEIKRVVNNFLQMLDNFKGDSILFAATNHQNMLDSAIWRRFDAVIDYVLPDEEARKKLFERFLRPIKRDKKINLSKAAITSQGLSPADIKMVTEEAMKSVIIDARNILEMGDLETAIEQFIRREKIKKNGQRDE
ncbi:AAA family ATPase [sulfur-oxidizing endosymbiont of Gigantopelta aegis]|uniref:AAA family ATPase n=1 Tax=sulfur-oxidizing endosymbiont of Gigantopelta aegis TaxID=2794934 RepID=UPI0018DCDBBB|nr:ATP-binding protein [sulfur-oxidizing endosymbiont of Gigantopelta aegis]